MYLGAINPDLPLHQKDATPDSSVLTARSEFLPQRHQQSQCTLA